MDLILVASELEKDMMILVSGRFGVAIFTLGSYIGCLNYACVLQ